MFELPAWAWGVVGWLVLCVAFAAGVGRWFNWLRDDEQDRWR